MKNTKNPLSKSISKLLLKWFNKNKRPLPWRKNLSPYSVWISEIMLQQTVLKTVIPYFNHWMKKYPDIQKLATAKEKELLTLWEGLGYYNRVRNILKTTKIITKKYNGEIPNNYQELIKLPGIGNYTASAILSIAFGQPHPAIDANIRRIMQRFLGWKQWNTKREKQSHLYLQAIIPLENPGGFNEALMELGQLLCLAKNPFCPLCPIRKHCYSFKNNLQNKIPAKAFIPSKHKETIILLLIHKNKILITKKENGILKGLWVLPSSKKNNNNKIRTNKFIDEEIASNCLYVGCLSTRTHYYTQFKEKLYPQIFSIKKPYKEGRKGWKWVNRDELNLYPFPSVYRKILNEFKKKKTLHNQM